jgi:hypothetical protein
LRSSVGAEDDGDGVEEREVEEGSVVVGRHCKKCNDRLNGRIEEIIKLEIEVRQEER